MSEIWHYIAVENEPAADRLLNSLFEKFDLAARHPDVGSPRPELSATARLLVEGRYIAIYEPTSYGIEVVAIVYAMRDPSIWLE